MSTRGRGRQQQSLRSRLFSWAGTTAPPSQRQPSRVTTTTLAQPPSPASAEGQPSPQPNLSPSGAPSRRSSSSSQPPPSSSAKPPQMGPAPSRPASDTRSPWTPPPGPTQTTARAPPLSTSPVLSDGASPRSQPGEGALQPPRRIPSRQVSRTYTQPPSPLGPPSPTQLAEALPGPSPSPPPPPAPFPAPPAITTEPKAPSPTPSPALSTSPSPPPPAEEPPSPQIRPPSPKEISEVPPPAPKVLHPVAASTKQEGKEEETTASPAAKLQPQETFPEEDQTAMDPASIRSEVARQPPAAEAGEKHISTATHTVRPPSPPGEMQRDISRGHLPPIEDEIDQKQPKDSSKPPKPEPEEEEETKLEPEPEAKEEEKVVIGPEAGQKSDPRLPHVTEREVDRTGREKRTVNQAELDQESDTYRPKNIDVNPEDVKNETPNSSQLPAPAENPQIKDQRETPTRNTQETRPAPSEQTQIKNSQEAAEDVEKTKQATQEPQQQPTQVRLQPVREVKLSDAIPAREKQTLLPEKEPEPPTGTTIGKEGKIAISTVARASASSGGEQSGGLHKEIKEGISRLVQSLAVQHTKQTGGGQGISIITLAGDNQGATMYVGHETPTREGKKSVFVHKGPLANAGGGGGDAMAPGEDIGQKKTEQQLKQPTTETNANVNSNVQAVNNSILHESCCSEENPGVHLVLSTRPPELAPQKETAKPAQMQKPRTRAPLLPKMAQEPTVRRRCLRAMFLESSDDDPENPQKPRRHGCRFSCDEKKSGNG